MLAPAFFSVADRGIIYIGFWDETWVIISILDERSVTNTTTDRYYSYHLKIPTMLGNLVFVCFALHTYLPALASLICSFMFLVVTEGGAPFCVGSRGWFDLGSSQVGKYTRYLLHTYLGVR